METITIKAETPDKAAEKLLNLVNTESIERFHATVLNKAGEQWARVEVDNILRGLVSAFPCYEDGRTGDAERRVAHMGVNLAGGNAVAARLVMLRSKRMHAAKVA